ncbi:glycoside hydrolase family 32 protein [Hespellia stercorisuis]|uniref:Sucrose-6-phosphate hydrolase n=1 Tax=Hespellia stercorisuis DSM 15480 TaxID=1121950 RepID=A0A1M6UI46_9FIRM|nr:glycoside hydrolase family 32 protein [Hespellia stercorisuis]SHK68925.1 beta-fructofuranosidase [Hespellia stercorisuis DSM 15480]
MCRELMQQNIEKAQCEIDSKKDIVKKGKMRQRYHFMAQTGWLNDPNGLIYFRGKYHFFFQYNPYSAFWDNMYWGHAMSDDMLHWEYLPLALAPSETYDDYQRGGCFSGSAIEHDGKLFLMYTGATNEGNGSKQTHCIAYSEDGIHFEKYEGNPVITAPEGIPGDLFRDPKVWKHEDLFYMVCGASRDNKGQALLYRSKDLFHWTFFNVLAESRGEWGYMWECPDFYPLGDKYVLTFSPMSAGEHTSVYFVGDFDYETGKFICHSCDEIDWGFDFYAPQSFETPEGRRIMVGWSNEWEWMPLWKDWGPTFKEDWCGFFNIPREVRLTEEGKLQFLPIAEVETMRENEKKLETFEVTEEESAWKVGDGVSYELKLKIDLQKTDAEKLELDLRCGEDKKTICMFDFKKAEMSVDRNDADGWSKGVSRSAMNLKDKTELDVHVLSDQSSLEIFTGQYQNCHSNNIFAGNAQNQVKIRAHGGRVYLKDVEMYGLK